MAPTTMDATVQDIRVFVETPKALKPNLPWDELANNLIIPRPLPQIQSTKGITDCRPEKLLKAVGAAITDDRLARGCETPEEIFSSENKFKVVSCVNRVLIKLSSLHVDVIGSENVHEIVENCLLEEGETLAAKGYLLFRTQKQRRVETSKKLEVIRRSGKRVAWNPDKIFTAIYKAFLAEFLDSDQEPQEQDRGEAFNKATKVMQKVLFEITSSAREMIHIEEIQDIVQKSLEEQGFHKTAQRYENYRIERTRLRALKEQEEKVSYIVPELVTPNLLARIDFGMIDLDIPLSRQELAQKLIT